MNSWAIKPGDFPVSEKIASELISLPMFPELTEEQVAYVAGALKEAKRVAKRVQMEDGRWKMEAKEKNQKTIHHRGTEDTERTFFSFGGRSRLR